MPFLPFTIGTSAAAAAAAGPVTTGAKVVVPVDSFVAVAVAAAGVPAGAPPAFLPPPFADAPAGPFWLLFLLFTFRRSRCPFGPPAPAAAPVVVAAPPLAALWLVLFLLPLL